MPKINAIISRYFRRRDLSKRLFLIFAFDIKFLSDDYKREEESVIKNWALRNLIYSRFLLAPCYESREKKRDANFFVFYIQRARICRNTRGA